MSEPYQVCPIHKRPLTVSLYDSDPDPEKNFCVRCEEVWARAWIEAVRGN